MNKISDAILVVNLVQPMSSKTSFNTAQATILLLVPMIVRLSRLLATFSIWLFIVIKEDEVAARFQNARPLYENRSGNSKFLQPMR
jgi:hypothetical protein